MSGQVPIEKYRDALGRITSAAFGSPDRSFASIPARPNVDADLLLSRALDELEAARKALEAKDSALKGLLRVIEIAGGPVQLSMGVQLGQMSWAAKCDDAIAEARLALEETP